MTSPFPMSQPPPLPGEKARRALRIARIDGLILVILAGGFALVSSACADLPGAVAGFAAAACGYMELRGRHRLQNGDASGTKLLIGCQLALLGVILLYVVYQYFCYDPAPALTRIDSLLADTTESAGLGKTGLAELLGLTPVQLNHLARLVVKGSCLLVGALSLLFQGGMAFYYHQVGRNSKIG